MLSLDLPFLLLELDLAFAELLLDLAFTLLELDFAFAELLLVALLEAGLTELLDFAELEEDAGTELEDCGGSAEELLATLLELSGSSGSK